MRLLLLLSPFYVWLNWGMGKSSNYLQAHTARKWSQDLTLGNQTPEPALLTCLLRTFLVVKTRRHYWRSFSRIVFQLLLELRIGYVSFFPYRLSFSAGKNYFFSWCNKYAFILLLCVSYYFRFHWRIKDDHDVLQEVKIQWAKHSCRDTDTHP